MAYDRGSVIQKLIVLIILQLAIAIQLIFVSIKQAYAERQVIAKAGKFVIPLKPVDQLQATVMQTINATNPMNIVILQNMNVVQLQATVLILGTVMLGNNVISHPKDAPCSMANVILMVIVKPGKLAM